MGAGAKSYINSRVNTKVRSKNFQKKKKIFPPYKKSKSKIRKEKKSKKKKNLKIQDCRYIYIT